MPSNLRVISSHLATLMATVSQYTEVTVGNRLATYIVHIWSLISSQPVGIGERHRALLFLLFSERAAEAAVPLHVSGGLPDAAGAVHPVAVVVGPLQVGAGVARLLRLLGRILGSSLPPQSVQQCHIFCSFVQMPLRNRNIPI